METNKEANKRYFVLGVVIFSLISFLIGHLVTLNYKKEEIRELHTKNKNLINKIDSLDETISKLNKGIQDLDKELINKQKDLKSVEKEIIKLKSKKDEIPVIVNNMSANVVANTLSSYIKKRTNNKNNR